MNGTGPYRLESRTPGEEIVLVLNEDYWRTEPIWAGGPSGPAAIERVIIKTVAEQDIRIDIFQSGDTDIPQLIRQNLTELDRMLGEICDYNPDTLEFDCSVVAGNEEAPFRLYQGFPEQNRFDAMFFFDINTEGGNQLLGSGQLDGDGIPPDFFHDIDVRKAFNYCFDWQAFIEEVYLGEAVQNTGVLIPGMPGYDQDGPQYTFDLDKCREHIERAWGGAVAENGFRVQLPYHLYSKIHRLVGETLQSGFQAIDPKYQIEVIGLPFPDWQDSHRNHRMPIFVSPWFPDIHDPHNWAQPFTVGLYAVYQGVPGEIIAGYSELVDAGVSTTDPAEREAIYRELQQLDYDNAIAIRGAVPTGRKYMQRWVSGWYYNPIAPGEFFYALSID
jgi:peptide/nickel transport system substrate-binding protein